MLITRFEALGLLPNAEIFDVYLTDGKGRERRRLSLDGILEQLPHDLYIFGKIEGIRRSAMIMSAGGQLQVPVDTKKAQRFIKSNGGQCDAYDFAYLEGRSTCPNCGKLIKLPFSPGDFECEKCGAKLEFTL